MPRIWKAIPYALFSVIICYIGYKVWTLNSLLSESQILFPSSTFLPNSPKWFLILFLCPINWILEAAKWRVSTRTFSSISITQSLKAVLSGQALNLIVPGSVGHYAGRIAHAENDKLKRVAAVFVCQAWQMAVTFGASLIGLWYWGTAILPFRSEGFILIAICTLLGVVSIGVIVKQVHIEWLEKIRVGFRELSARQFAEIGAYSLIRYLVFTTQFVLMLQLAGASTSWYELTFAISLVFMAKSMMPSIHFLSDLGLREFCALLFLPTIGIKEEVVLLASLAIWVVNILLPSLVGAFMILHIKMVRVWQ